MESDERLHKVKELEDQIKALSKQLDEIQNECPHKETSIKATNERGTDLRKVCTSCNRAIGYLSPREVDEWKTS